MGYICEPLGSQHFTDRFQKKDKAQNGPLKKGEPKLTLVGVEAEVALRIIGQAIVRESGMSGPLVTKTLLRRSEGGGWGTLRASSN